MGTPSKDDSTKYEPPSSLTLHKNKPVREKTEFEQLAHRFCQTPYPALVLSVLNLFSLPGSIKAIRGYPSVMPCTTYTAAFAASAYALHTGDWINGSGLTAGWSAIWLFFNARNAIRSGRAFPLGVTAMVASIGSVYGYSYATIGRE
ncbi:hypothetical protein IW140_000816 [Coemansia sp. RSA 1813]|nr:hypothetical protein LPJ74_004980 [Coemansia sp. RSA 1843]KAJ2093358.1 hypothetical protein IW138_000208 [Coemansia sp. RSA 986]KAJ2217167.1 hypothetical protein EV179_000634 [Coemansia sp. RSA 487]KAJ2572365.1 hypothetical protein IW140_000816 [Coemansia sp. RSA 1813]